MSVEEAIHDPGLRAEGIEDFEALQAIEKIFQDEKDIYSAVHPLAFFEEWSALVMEELDAQPLRNKLVNFKMAYQREWREAFENLLVNTGRWLRIYHEKLAGLYNDAFISEGIRQNIEISLNTIKSAYPKIDSKRIHHAAELLQIKYKDVSFLYGSLHCDFNCSNVLITKDFKVAALDPRFIKGPAYADVAKMMIDLETYSLETLSYGFFIQPALMRRFHQAILHGYFGEKPYQKAALDFYCVFSILEKWQSDEDAIQEARHGKKSAQVFFHSIIFWRRSYFTMLLNRYLRELEKPLYG